MLQEIKSGVRREDHGESWISWAFFKRVDGGSASEHDLKDEMGDITGMGYFYNGPGRAFGGHADFKINKHHALISQSCGFDI